jgi:uncharacterized membrane protein YfcA
MDFSGLSIIFVVSILGGAFGTLVGGTSLLTIPVLIFLGFPPHTAIGTDRLGISGLTTVGWYKFHQKGLIHYSISLWMGVAALIGSFLGANLVLGISMGLLRKIIAAATVLILIIVVAQPRLGLEKRKQGIRGRAYGTGIFLGFIIGIYGGFYGAMAGTFLLYVLLFVFEQTFLEGAATLKITSLMMTTMAAAMFLGCAIGSYIGAHYSDRIGNVWIKRLFIFIVLIMVVKLLIP